MDKIENIKGRVRSQNSKTLRVINALKEPDYKRKRELDLYYHQKNKTPDFINNKKIEELDHILSRIDTGVEIEHMINGKVFNLKYDDSYFYINGEESSKSTSGVISTIMDDVNKSNYTLSDALENLSFEKKDLVKEMIMDEIVDFRDDVNKKEDIVMLDIGKLFDKYYDDNLGELDRIYNNFFGISKGLILPEEKIKKNI